MHILFYLPVIDKKNITWDGNSIRNGGVGVSGSHQSFVVAAEQIAKHIPSASVYFLNAGNGNTTNGVKYLLTGIEEANVHDLIDVIVFPSWINNVHDEVQKFAMYSKVKHFVVWYQCQYCYPLLQQVIQQSIASHPGSQCHFVHLSNWSARNVNFMVKALGFLQGITSHMIVPNPLISDTLPPLSDLLLVKPRNFVFMACFERGGDVARRTHDLVKSRDPMTDWGKFITCTYNENNSQADKQGLFNTLQNCRYFVYPLVCPPTFTVHRDTFGCVVAEALAMGVEVFSYPVGALPEHYGDMIHWIPFPEGYSTDRFNDNVLDTPCPEMFNDEQVKVIADLVEDLDKTYDDRQIRRCQNALQVRKKFHMESIGKAWVDFVHTLT